MTIITIFGPLLKLSICRSFFNMEAGGIEPPDSVARNLSYPCGICRQFSEMSRGRTSENASAACELAAISPRSAAGVNPPSDAPKSDARCTQAPRSRSGPPVGLTPELAERKNAEP